MIVFLVLTHYYYYYYLLVATVIQIFTLERNSGFEMLLFVYYEYANI